MALFESYERRIDKINAVLNSYGISSIEEAEKITKDAGLDVYDQVKKIQPICFENACWAYTVGAAIAIKKGCRKAAEAAAEAATKTATEQRLKQDISICIGRFRKMRISRNEVVKIIAEDYSMNEKEAQNCVDECWTA